MDRDKVGRATFGGLRCPMGPEPVGPDAGKPVAAQMPKAANNLPRAMCLHGLPGAI